MNKTVVELFAGVGGFRCGFNNVELNNGETVENGDWDFVWANQWEPSTKTQDAFNCYVKRFGKSENHSNMDISQVDKTTIPDHSLLVGGFPCLTADTLVLTNGGYKNIVDVNVGDTVLTHEGRYKKVSALLEQGVKKIYGVSGLTFDNIKITGNHLLYVRKLEDGKIGIPEWKSVEDLCQKDEMGVPLYKSYLYSNTINGSSRIPKIKGLDLGDRSFMYALGRYLALGNSEENMILFPKTYMKDSIKAFLDTFYRDEETIIPGCMFDLATNLMKFFIDGYLSVVATIDDNDTTSFCVKGRTLAYSLSQCISKIYRTPTSVTKMSSLNEDSDKYFLIFNKKLINYENCYYLNQHIWCPFKDIQDLDKEEMVYDLTVEDSHSFLANNCMVHNCQDYSVARSLSNEKGIEGKKGVLWWEIADILDKKKPPFVLLENVDRLLMSPSKQRGRDFAIMLRTFYDYGYSVQWQVINAAEYGLPQKRKRVFIFAFRNDTLYFEKIKDFSRKEVVLKESIFAKNFPITEDKIDAIIKVQDYEDVIQVSENYNNGAFLSAGCMINGTVYTAKVKAVLEDIKPLKDILVQQPVAQNYFLNEEETERFRYLKGNKRIPRVKPNGEPYTYSEGQMPFPDNLEVPARTMLTSESTVNRSTHVVQDVTSGNLRYLTPIEAERINCFPDNWTDTGMSEKRRYFMMGNALVVGIISRLQKDIGDIIENENKEIDTKTILDNFLREHNIDRITDVYDVLKYLGFEMKSTELEDKNLDGLLIVNEEERCIKGFNSNKVIAYNKNRYLSEKNFLMAYFLAQYILHKYTNDSVFYIVKVYNKQFKEQGLEMANMILSDYRV